MDEMTHERCSELLRAYTRNELEAEQARAVEAHLAGCSDCASEHRALLALEQVEPDPLTEIERARMRRVVLNEAVPIPDADASRPSPAPTRGRLLPLLGAAAVVLLAAVFAYTGLGDMGLGGSDEGATTAEPEVQLNEEAADGDTVDAAGGVEELSEGAGASRAKAPPLPSFRPSIGEVDSIRLNRLGRRGLPLVVFSRAYTVEDVPRLRDRYVELMADEAPTARAAQLRECIAGITSNFPNALPAYSAVGEFAERPRREVLVAAFAWTDEPEGPLDQSMVWAWPLGSCDSVAHYSKNVIEPRS